MSVREVAYEVAMTVARPVLAVAAPFNEKIRQGLQGRRASLERLAEWSRTSRDPARPLVWFHAPSVGESLMTKAVVGVLRERRPELQVVYTFFSPSAERVAGRVGADVHAYLPWDVRADMRRALELLSPTAIGFVRTEVWPVLTREARARGVRMALINAVLPDTSTRAGKGARLVLAPVYRRLDGIGAVSKRDADRYTTMFGVPRGRVRVTGDARFDQVWERAESLGLRNWRAEIDVNGRSWEIVEGKPREQGGLKGRRPFFRLLRHPSAMTVIAGSTWPADERVIVPAFAAAARTRPFRFIIVPHEPTEAHLTGLERRLDRHGFSHARLAALEAAGGECPEVVVVDRVGVLAELYAVTDVAYVGGGFHGAGLHSVVEPAALGIPVLIGPQHVSVREAGELLEAGGAFVVKDPAELKERLHSFQADAGAFREAGQAAEGYVRSQLGAAERNAELILELI